MPRRRLIAVSFLFTLTLAGCSRTDVFSCGCIGAAPAFPPGTEQDMVATAGDRVYFGFAKSNLSRNAEVTLGKQAAWLAKYPAVDILIAGNADERGTETYNLALGQRRADAARDHLIASGVAPGRITTISYGKDRPVAPGHDENSWQRNRNAITSVHGFNQQDQKP
jgi:peptidoglycan-associated lipoprotein